MNDDRQIRLKDIYLQIPQGSYDTQSVPEPLGYTFTRPLFYGTVNIKDDGIEYVFRWNTFTKTLDRVEVR